MSVARQKTKPLLIVIGAPSGAGKTSILHGLLKKDKRLKTFNSVTTRPKSLRKGGDSEYTFVTPAKFKELKKAGKFLESAQVHGHWYGTLRSDLDKVVRQGRIPIRVIDVQGLLQIKKNKHYHVCSLFINAESMSELKRRIIARQPSVSPEEVERRLATARQEIKKKHVFDAVQINRRGKLQEATERVARWVDKCIRSR